jgi:hypothetical protein
MKLRCVGMIRILGSIIAFLSVAAILAAQVITGTIVGNVHDQSGAVIPGARVVATNLGTGYHQEVVANERGLFSLPGLPNGSYSVEVGARGFMSLKQGPITLNSNQRLSLDLSLTPGRVEQTVDVKGDAQRIQTQEATVKAQIYLDQVQNLPMNSRSPFELGLLAPSIQTNRQQSGPSVQYTINGQNANGYKLAFDGAEVGIGGDAQYFAANNFNLSITSLDAIQEFDIATSNYSAEIKGSSGYVNFVSKSGTNKLHGDVYDYFRNGALDAANYFQAKKGSLKQNDFGATFTGPIVKNKIFFMVSYEGQRIHLPFAGFANVPTEAFRATVDARLKPLLKLTPLPTEAIAGNANVGIYRTNVAAVTNQNLITGRVDFNLSDKDRVFTQYTFNDGQLHGGGPTTSNGTSIFPGISNSQPERHQFATAGWTHTFSPTLLNDLNLALNRYLQGRRIGPNDENDFALPGAAVPGLVLAGGGNIKKLGNTQPQLTDKVTWVKGKSTLSFGGNYIYLMSGQSQKSFINMSFPTLAAFAADAPSTLSSTFGTSGRELAEHLHWHQVGLFVQEDLRATPNLTLNMGLRYDNFGVFADSARNARNVIKGPFDAFRAPDAPLYSANHDFGPRFGFAWKPVSSKPLVILGGAGIFYGTHVSGQMGDVLVLNAVHPFSLTTADFPDLSYPFSPALLQNANTTVGRFVLDPDTPDLYTEQWNLSAQYQLAAETVLTVGYVGNHSVHVPGTLLPNNFDPVLGHRPNTNFGAIREVTNADSMHYHGLQMSLRRRLSNNLAFDLNYSWSKATGLETGSLEISAAVSFSSDQIQAYKAKNLSRGTLPIDVTHNFASDLVYQLPRLNGSGAFVKNVFGGWTTSGIVRASTGLPFNITTGQDTGDLNFTQRPNLVSGVPLYLSGRNPAQGFVNPAAFAVPTAVDPATGLKLGNFGNNKLRMPATFTCDWTLGKRLYGSERFNVDFRSEFFNLLNHPVFGFPTSSLSAGGLFGKSTSATDPRQIQFMLKASF